MSYNLLKHNLTPEELSKLSEDAISGIKAAFDRVANLKEGEHNFDTVIKAIAAAEWSFSLSSSIVEFPIYVSPDEKVREAATDSSQKVRDATVELYSREDVYKSILAYEKKRETLEGEDKKFFEKVKLDFERNGLKLPSESREKVTELKKRISQLSLEFEKACNEDTSFITCTPEELDGMDSEYLSRLEKDAEGKYIVTMKYPDAQPLLNNCKVEETRKRCEFSFSNRGGDENVKRMEEVLALRHEVAQLMGYPNHASYVLEERMAKSPETVKTFEDELRQKLEGKGKEEREKLLQLKKEDCEKRNTPFDNSLNAWDWLYYDNLLLKTEYGVDENEIMKYFPLDSTIKGTFDIYQELFQLRFKKLENFSSWHPEVMQYEIYDARDDQFLGAFYLDLHPRDGKYGHAAVFLLQNGCLNESGEMQPPVCSMVCNFTKPTATSPSLMRHEEFETFFHEFGHVIHAVCGHTKYSRFSGTQTESDFLECPSQALENWCWEKSILQRISKHHQTGQPLPDELIDKLIAAKLVNVGLKTLRQVFFGVVDQLLHTEKVDVNQTWEKLRTEITLVPHTPGTHSISNFSHLVGGYDAGYYGYLYSQVFSADIYEQFLQQGVMNSDLGLQYRLKILSLGGKGDAMDYLVDFLGRKPTQDAFLRSIGINV